MLNFKPDFFKKEIMWDYSVGEVMKRAWAVQLDLLKAFVDFCDTHGITYYMFFGSLIGAIRHNGFIPWDDDLDIAMLRDDYMKFIDIASKELPHGCKLVSAYTYDEWDSPFCRVINNDYKIDSSEEFLQAHYDCPWLSGLDVFPLTYLPNDEDFASQLTELYQMVDIALTAVKNSDEIELEGEEFMSALDTISEITGFSFDKSRPYMPQLLILEEKIAMIPTVEEGNGIIPYGLYYGGHDLVFQKEDFQPISWDFNGIEVTVPEGYDRILRTNFGDYMIPIRGRSTHDFPFFKGQAKELGKLMDMADILDKQGKESLQISIGNEAMQENDVPDEMFKASLPLEWYDRVYREGDAKRSKILLFHTSSEGMLCNSGYYIEKLKRNFQIFKESDEVCIWWLPISFEKEILRKINRQAPDLTAEYIELTKEFVKAGIGIYDMSGDVARAVTLADAYYGDEGFIMDLFKETGKPIMLQNYEL